MNFLSFVDTLGISSVQMKQHKDIIVSTKYLWEELCVSDAKIRNFRPTWPARIHFIFPSFRLVGIVIRYYETNQPTQGHIVPIFFFMLLYQQDIIDWLRRITCFRRKSAKISVRSLHSLAIIFMGFSRVSGRNKSSWKGPYHECYDIGAGSGGGDRGAAAPNPKSGGGGGQNAFCPPPPKKKEKREKEKYTIYKLRLVYSNV